MIQDIFTVERNKLFLMLFKGLYKSNKDFNSPFVMS